MTLVIDTGPLLSLADREDARHAAVAALLRSEPGDLVLPATVSAEADHMIGRRLGRRAQRAFLEDLAEGRFAVMALTAEEHADALQVHDRYEDLSLGLADLSVVVLAHRVGTRRLLTFDRRHFTAVRPLDGGHFELLPDTPGVSGRAGGPGRRS